MAPLIPKLLKQKIIYCIVITTKNKGRRVFNDMKKLGVLFPVIAIISVAVILLLKTNIAESTPTDDLRRGFLFCILLSVYLKRDWFSDGIG